MKKITGIILSGGQSSRMGEDKALMKVGTKTILELVIDKIKPFCDEIIISADKIDDYSEFGYKVVPDKYKNSGPLAGIYSSLLESNSEKNFIISCDLPLVSSKLIKQLIEINTDKEIVLPVTNGKYHHLCGIYSKSVLERAEEILRKGNVETLNERRETKNGNFKKKTSVKKLLDISEVELVDVTKMVSENEFLNMNTKEDFAIIEKLLSETG